MIPESVLLSSGGTGGHILPAAAFGRWINQRYPAVRVGYISGRRPVELEIYRSLKIEPLIIDIEGSPFGAPPGKRLLRWRDMFRSFGQAGRCMRRDTPNLLVAFGGYVSAAAVFSARARRIPIVAHEQNALAGKVTIFARALGARVATGWNRCDPLRPGSFTPVGVPVRALPGMSREDAVRKLLPGPLEGGGPVVAVMTGSLGSGSLARIISGLSGMKGFDSWNFIIIDPNVDRPEMAAGNAIHIPRLWDIAPLFNLADILITRGGASTLAEADASGIPTVVIPWRRAAGDHQMKNAVEMARGGRAEIFDETAGDPAELAEKLLNLCRHYPPAEKDIGKRMYNASINVCERLWDFCCAFLEGRD
ncbi:MAG: UDP-N-acetylglucosamine--N-acetylmuramyl-(pentapeptide) pyrophosphoryl-undecaprenol N-acetylglucosamine transferase [Synergistaceae bacterium]|jgi:UDP-N-acetylglucosamine--N-acetylmuramyl-(pentapeptide) pyrophosphoryl-undecaprenol N-acetylglucosamine transferase|nr:UDP-N-acetylglucosamine--N-acetylmuramyl-(pentapeptide) pyrophosphoryl-undecaprenol N-acetylglucosamine transferase [Synergistaceae bacterium]